MDFDHALKNHDNWRHKLHMAMRTRERLDTTQIRDAHCCELGRWLHGEARSRYNRLGSYSACVNAHAEFHRHTAEVALAINAGRYQEAQMLLDDGNAPYAEARRAIRQAVHGLRREAYL